MDYDIKEIDSIAIVLAMLTLLPILGSAATSNRALLISFTIIFCTCLFLLADFIRFVIKIKTKENNIISIGVFIVRIIGILFIGLFLYNFVMFDYKYYKTHQGPINLYLTVSVSFIIFDRILNAIKHRKIHKKHPYSQIKTTVVIYSLIAEFVILFFCLYQAIMPKTVHGLSNVNMPAKVYVINKYVGQQDYSALLLGNEGILKRKSSKEFTDVMDLKFFYDALYNKSGAKIMMIEKIKLFISKADEDYTEIYFKYDKTDESGNLARLTIRDGKIVLLEGYGLSSTNSKGKKFEKLYMNIFQEDINALLGKAK